MQSFEKFLTAMGSRDITTHLAEAARSTTWKTAPGQSVKGLAEAAPLFLELCKVAPNGILPPKRTAQALVKMHKEKPLNFTNKELAVWSDGISSTVRQCMSKLRDLKQDPLCARRAFQKARNLSSAKHNTHLQTLVNLFC
jgi:hypothetical protein